MKNVKIYQLNETNETAMKIYFMGYDFVKENNITLSLDLYNIVYEGEVEDDVTLDDIYRKFNIGRKPEGYIGHSLSVSDIVELDGKYYYCDSYGWEEVSFSAEEKKMFYVKCVDKFDNDCTFITYAKDAREATVKAYEKRNIVNVIQVVEDVKFNNKTQSAMETTEKKVAMTTSEKVFNLCVESAKMSKSGYMFSLKAVWTAARKKYKMAKDVVLETVDAISQEHEIRQGKEEGTFILAELMPKPAKNHTAKKQETATEKREAAAKSDRPKEVKHQLTPCEVINLDAQKKARELYPDQFKRFVFFRFDATNEKEYKNVDLALRGKADMDNLLYGIEVVEGVRYTGTTRINAYENFLAAATV